MNVEHAEFIHFWQAPPCCGCDHANRFKPKQHQKLASKLAPTDLYFFTRGSNAYGQLAS